MTESEARNALADGYYRGDMESEEAYGLLVKYFPEVVDGDKDLGEMVAEACFS